MRICFLNHSLNPATGAGRFGLNLIGRMLGADKSLEAVVLTTAYSGHALERPILAANWFGLLLALPRIRAEFRRADIIHALDGYPYGVIAALALIGMRRLFIITAIGTGAVQPLHRRQARLVSWAYRRAKRVVAISANTRDEILACLSGLQIAVVNHAVDADEFLGEPFDGLSSSQRTEIERLRPYVLSVGSWKKRKGFEYSFAAFAEITKRFPQMRHIVCGIGSKPRLEKPLGLEGRVSYFKNVGWPFVKALYRNAELFMLLPVDDNKDIEGFGFVFLEAAAAGLPVIGTIGTGAADAMLDGENGFLVPQRDASSAAHAAIRVLSDTALRRRFRSSSLDFARRMNWGRVISAYRAIYREAAAQQ